MRLGIIGAGRVGASFVLAFPQDVCGIVCSTSEHTQQMAQRLHVPAYPNGAALAANADVVLLTVQDDALAGVAQQLAAGLAKTAPRTACFFHCSGAQDLSPLRPLQELGYSIGSIHPLQSFAAPDAANLHGIYMAVDGDEGAKKTAVSLVQALGSIPFFVPEKERMLYHAAACFCSNYVVTAVATAQQLMARWTATEEDAAKALWPLVAGTMKNLHAQKTFRQALTGPISRGDSGTVEKHLSCLPESVKPLYAALGLQTANLAAANGTITEKTHADLKRILAMAEGDYQWQKK